MFEELEQDLDILDAELDSESLLPPHQNSKWYGEDSIEQYMIELLESQKIPQAIVFSGPKGIGKSTMAFRVARYLLDKEHSNTEQDNLLFQEEASTKRTPKTLAIDENSKTYQLISAGAHPDLLYLERPYDEKKDIQKEFIDVNTAREILPFLRKTASLKGGRVVVIDDADTMNRNAQNAILKILEEPPKNSLLILIAHRPGALIPTIKSRCRFIKFPILRQTAFEELIQLYDPNLLEPDIKLLNQISNGSVGQAIDLLERGGIETIEKIISFFYAWPNWNWPQIHIFAEKAASKKSDARVSDLFEDIVLWMINSIIQAKARDIPKIDHLDSEHFKNLQSHYSLEQWLRICEKLNDHYNMVHNSNLDKRQIIMGTFSIISSEESH